MSRIDEGSDFVREPREEGPSEGPLITCDVSPHCSVHQPISYGARWGRVWKALASESPTISSLAGSQVSF